MDDFRNLRFRAPPVMVGAAYKEIGVAAVAMGGGDILPALEKVRLMLLSGAVRNQTLYSVFKKYYTLLHANPASSCR